MLAQYDAVCQYLLAERRVSGSDNIAAGEAAQVRHLSVLFEKTTPTVEDATALLNKLTEPTIAFSPENRAQLATIVSTIVRNQKLRSTGTKTQTNLFVYKYMTETTWSTLMHDDVSMKTKEIAMNEMMLQIGCPHPSERTYVVMSAILNATTKGRRTPQQSLGVLNELKSDMVERRNRRPGKQTMSTFPENVEEFLAIHGDCYTVSEPPVLSRVPIDQIISLCAKNVQPARSSNSLVKPSVADVTDSAQCNRSTLDPLLQALISSALSTINQRSIASTDIPIHMNPFAMPGASAGMPSMVGPTPLALPGPPPMLALGPGPFPHPAPAMPPVDAPRLALTDADRTSTIGVAADPVHASDEATKDVTDVFAKVGAAITGKSPKAKPAAMKKPSAAPTSKVEPPKKKAKAVTPAAAAAVVKPAPAKTPTSYNGGKLYTSDARKCIRCYVRKTDKVESTFKFDPKSNASFNNAWEQACMAIDTDPRPR